MFENDYGAERLSAEDLSSMEKKKILDIFSNVLGFDCSDFGEVMDNGVMNGVLYPLLKDAKKACESIKALANLLDYEDKDFRVYKQDDGFYGIYTPKELEELPKEVSELFTEVE